MKPLSAVTVASFLAVTSGCENSVTDVGRLPPVKVVIVASSCAGIDLCGQCPIEVLILDKNSNPTPGFIRWTTSDPSIGIVNEFGRFHGIRAGRVTVRAEETSTGVFDEADFNVPADCSFSLVSRIFTPRLHRKDTVSCDA